MRRKDGDEEKMMMATDGERKESEEGKRQRNVFFFLFVCLPLPKKILTSHESLLLVKCKASVYL